MARVNRAPCVAPHHEDLAARRIDREVELLRLRLGARCGKRAGDPESDHVLHQATLGDAVVEALGIFQEREQGGARLVVERALRSRANDEACNLARLCGALGLPVAHRADETRGGHRRHRLARPDAVGGVCVLAVARQWEPLKPPISYRAPHRDPGAGPRDLSPVAADPALPRTPPRASARDARTNLLQVRGRQPGRHPQAEHRRRAGVLLQARGGQAHHHGDRRGPVGLVARVRGRALRPPDRRLHGAGELRPEALPPRAHGDLRRALRGQPLDRDRHRPRHPREEPALDRARS